MQLADFDYHLPEELIAQEALADRAASRMLVVHRERGCWEDRTFRDLPEYLHPGDCLVVNDSRVFPARLFGHRAGVRALPIGKNNPKVREYLSGTVEVFLLRSVSADGRDWEALVRPGRKLPVGERIRFDEGLEGEIVAARRVRRAHRPLSRRWGSLSPPSSESATCPFRPTSSAPIRPPTATATRRSSLAKEAPSRRRRPGFTSRRKCWPAAAKRAPNRRSSPSMWVSAPFSPCTRKWSNRRRCTASTTASRRKTPPRLLPRAAWWPSAPPASAPWKPPPAPANSKAKPRSSSIPACRS